MSIFDLEEQNVNVDNKIVAGLLRLSQVFKTLLSEKARIFGLSPIQIQLLIFIKYHKESQTTESYLAREFNLTQQAVSDEVKILEQKKLLEKNVYGTDSKSYSLNLSTTGETAVNETENYMVPVSKFISQADDHEKIILWANIAKVIGELNKLGVIQVQRSCVNCKYHSMLDKNHHCSLVGRGLHTNEIRIDCREFQLH